MNKPEVKSAIMNPKVCTNKITKDELAKQIKKMT